ncbi:unnamed protein product [Adineta steineri]|uniref:Uncharacterized protein n=1 Tax=Adineta steineri TaxID=433720 RepID=A0A813UYJ9_9BILA|nr:unnamed protein product [Adineta steineri]
MSTYSGNLNNNSLSFTRPNQQQTGFYFMAVEVITSVTGSYKFVVDSAIDTYGCLYGGPFNSTQPMSNMITCDDDSGPASNFELKATLTAYQPTTVVVTTYTSLQTGSFTVQGYGPAQVTIKKIVPDIMSTYSGNLNNNSLSFTRPNQQQTGFYFMAVEVITSVTGSYKFVVDSAIDTYGCLYGGPFNSTQPMSNMITCDDDSGPASNFELKATLTAYQPTTVVVTTYTSLQTGSFSVYAYGPAQVAMRGMLPFCFKKSNIRLDTILLVQDFLYDHI